MIIINIIIIIAICMIIIYHHKKKYILFHIPHSGPKINMNIYEHIYI
jgi:hypothetical protein